MAYSKEQLQQIAQRLSSQTPLLIERGCPMCGAPAAQFGVERMELADLGVPLLAVACRACGHVMLFTEAALLAGAQPR
jgi:hypothetical protein